MIQAVENALGQSFGEPQWPVDGGGRRGDEKGLLNGGTALTAMTSNSSPHLPLCVFGQFPNRKWQLWQKVCGTVGNRSTR
jgi:hypothetical protein